MTDRMTGDPARGVGLVFLGVLAFLAVATADALIVWLIARQIDALSLSWAESWGIGTGYVVFRIIDRMAWPVRSPDKGS